MSQDAMQVLLEALAAISGHVPTEPFPSVFDPISYNRVQFICQSLEGQSMSYGTAVAAIRGLGEYMTTAQSLAVKRTAVIVRDGRRVGLIALNFNGFLNGTAAA